MSIVSDKDSTLTTHFWKSFQKAMGTQLTMSTTFHPQTDGQCDAPISGGPFDHRQPTKTCVSHIMRPIHE